MCVTRIRRNGSGAGYQVRARLATMMAGPGRGSWFVPDPGDELVAAFEAGDPRRPYVLGALWNGRDNPPESMDGAGSNDIRMFRSRSGHQIRMEDVAGSEKIVIRTPGGQTVTLADGPASMEIADSSGNTVTLDSSGITVSASAKVTITAASAEITASTLTVNAGMSTFSGVVKADTVITNSVVSAAYSPGAGNIC